MQDFLRRSIILFFIFSLIFTSESFAVTTTKNPSSLSLKLKKNHKKKHFKKQSQNYQNALPSNTTPFANAFSLQKIVTDMNHHGATTGVIVRDLPSGKVIYQNEAEDLYAPASNMKLLTAYAALKFLGADFVFHTQLLTDAPSATPVNGVLSGNLYVKYDGDPSLHFSDLDTLFHQLSAQGVHEIEGSVYVDTSRFDEEGVSPGTEETDRAYCYGAPVGSAIVNKNCVTLRVFPTHMGEAAKIASPYDIPVPLTNHVVTKSGMCAVRFTHDDHHQLVLEGSIAPRQKGVPLTVPLPCGDKYGQNMAMKLLGRVGIKVDERETPTSARHLTIVAHHDSEPLRVLVIEMMKKSDNLIANSLFKTIGAHYYQTTATWQNSAAAEKAILEKNGVNTQGMVIVDGSGLSRNNRVSPDQFSQVLFAAYRDPLIFADYEKALPVGGINGTLRNRLGSRDIIGKVKAKTGSMHGISSLSGYVETKNGKTLAFSIVVNGFVGALYPYRAMEDKLCRVLNAQY